MTAAAPLSAVSPALWPAGTSLLLGIGAQKAGTSWMHAYLSGHPQCVASVLKELHYFDAVAGNPGIGDRIRREAIARLTESGKAPRRLQGLKRLQEICANPDTNHQSYVDLVTEGVAPGKVALDVTPQYAVLSDAQFSGMAALQEAKFVFIMREPVARFWSGVRMRIAKRARPETFADDCRDWLDAALEQRRGPGFRRTDYIATLRRLEAHLPADRRLVLFFETLFSQASADRICAFLGIAPHPVDADTRRNSGLSADMRPDQVAQLTQIFRPQYEAVCAAFGPAVPQAWHARFAAGTTAA